MISACKEADVSLHVAYYRRFYPKFVFAKKMLDDGAIGAVLGANLLMRQMSGSGGWRVDPKVSGGGHFVDVGSHRLDMALFLLGGDISGAAGFAQNRLGSHTSRKRRFGFVPNHNRRDRFGGVSLSHAARLRCFGDNRERGNPALRAL